ncbi:hypothetical protein GCM10023085_66070 [Actinomadura viridis]|uniref:MFS transporter n=1 Tax=Actinomadura viridis TaxID=58110 RepID=A0A931GT03_9ACTN|nr:MFS transporter [Actinomadura viridis]MBG6091429.1 hypothetical protein [Actinomadura viridis]
MSCRSLISVAGALLLALTVPPAVALVLPGTGPHVLAAAEAGTVDARVAGAALAAGLALPALLVTVPLAAVLSRRFPARAVLPAGLACLAAGLIGVRFAGTVPQVAAARLLQGAGAGIMLPASLVLVWQRRNRVLAAVWAGSLVAGLLVATPLALHAATRAGDRAAAPFLWPAAAALVAALLCLAGRNEPLPASKHAERSQIVLPAAPAAGLAFLAVASSHDWSPGARLLVGCVALAAALGLALAAARDAAVGSPLSCAVVMVTAGLLTFPLAGPLAGPAAEGGTLLPFGAGGAAALAGALLAAALPGRGARAAVPAGHALVLAAALVALLVPFPPRPPLLAAVLIPLGLGVGLALAASLRDARAGAALFGLGVCFPAVLAGQLMALSLQAGRWQRVGPDTAGERLSVLAGGYRQWLVLACALAVLLAVAAWRPARRPPRRPARRAAAPSDGAEAVSAASAG